MIPMSLKPLGGGVYATNDTIEALVDEGIARLGKFADLNYINTSQVTSLQSVFDFRYGSFHGDISRWDTSSVTNLSCAFRMASYKGDISQWDTSKVTNMWGTFWALLNGWGGRELPHGLETMDVSKVTNMNECLLDGVLFNSPLNEWRCNALVTAWRMFDGCAAMSAENISLFIENSLPNRAPYVENKHKIGYDRVPALTLAHVEAAKAKGWTIVYSQVIS